MKVARIVSMAWLVMTVGIGAAASAWAGDGAGGTVLVLGDSIPFGYINAVDSTGYFYRRSQNFRSFANDLGDQLRLDVVNASCPGATTGSFLSLTTPDNGCKEYVGLSYPLHQNYRSTQAAFAIQYLSTHNNVRLVTITLGANDGFLLEASCASISDPTPQRVEACIAAGAPATFTKVAENLGLILAALRGTGYAGPIVLTNYYSSDYSDASQPGITELTEGLNEAIAVPASAAGAVVADVFTAFLKLSSDPAYGGQTCKSGLLGPDPVTPNACSVHPALLGHQVIADTIIRTISSRN
jgi:lysophospholipase L1-like esterase